MKTQANPDTSEQSCEHLGKHEHESTLMNILIVVDMAEIEALQGIHFWRMRNKVYLMIKLFEYTPRFTQS